MTPIFRILTFAAAGQMVPQLSVASEGGSGTPVPDLSLEVDIHRRMVEAGIAIAYGPTTEPWGVRRFFIRDPFGCPLDILSHEPAVG